MLAHAQTRDTTARPLGAWRPRGVSAHLRPVRLHAQIRRGTRSMRNARPLSGAEASRLCWQSGPGGGRWPRTDEETPGGSARVHLAHLVEPNPNTPSETASPSGISTGLGARGGSPAQTTPQSRIAARRSSLWKKGFVAGVVALQVAHENRVTEDGRRVNQVPSSAEEVARLRPTPAAQARPVDQASVTRSRSPCSRKGSGLLRPLPDVSSGVPALIVTCYSIGDFHLGPARGDPDDRHLCRHVHILDRGEID